MIEQCEIENEKKFYLSDADIKSTDDSSSLYKRASWTLSDAFKNLGLSTSKKWHEKPGLIHNHSFYHHTHPQSKSFNNSLFIYSKTI